MMVVMEVVTTALLLGVAAATQDPINLEGSPANTSPEKGAIAIPHQLPALLNSNLQDQTNLKQLDSSTNYHNISDLPDIYNEDAGVDIKNLDDENSKPKSQRMKRKVIFGGGSYGHTGRRSSAAVGGDPYGRRRDPHGSDYGNPLRQDSWPQRSKGSYIGASLQTPTDYVTTSTRRSDYVIVLRTTTPAPYRYTGVSNNQKKGLSSDYKEKTASNMKEAPPRKKLTRKLKWEIAMYALQNGAHKAAEQYGHILGRKLSAKKIDKFIKRYQKQQKRDKGYEQ